MIDRFLGFVAPHSCCGCGNLGSILCQLCKNDIVTDPFSACLSCLRPAFEDNLCLACADEMQIQAGWCVASREGSLKQLLDQYKFNSAKEAGRLCAELLDARLPLLPADLVIVPVPTAASHVRLRGFDHTKHIAKSFAAKRNLSVKTVLVRYSGETQHFKNRTERQLNSLRGLEVVAAVPPRILLLDDIYTTGSTLRACIRKLEDAGAKNLFVATIARQTLDDTFDL